MEFAYANSDMFLFWFSKETTISNVAGLPTLSDPAYLLHKKMAHARFRIWHTRNLMQYMVNMTNRNTYLFKIMRIYFNQRLRLCYVSSRDTHMPYQHIRHQKIYKKMHTLLLLLETFFFCLSFPHI